MSTIGALNAAILRQKDLEMTSASLKIMNPPLFPLTSSPTNARMIILASILGTLLFIIGYFLIIEILDRTLRDKIRAERITGGVIRKTKCFDFWERNVLFPKTKRSFFRTPKHPLPCPFPLNFSLLIITKKFGNLAKNRYICIV